MAVKFGPDRELLVEAETMQFLHAHIGASVPRVYGTLTEDCPQEDAPAAKCYYLVMEYIPGKSYLEELPSLAPAEKEDIQRQFRSIMDELRAVPSPGYYGRVGRRPLYDLIFGYYDSEGPTMRGPFANEEDLNNGIILLMDRLLNKFQALVYRQSITDAFSGHRPVFTHGDLQDRNLIVSQVGKREDGHRLFKLTLIDWELSGWFPDYWDFCLAACNNVGGQGWQELIHAGLDLYSKEYPMYVLLRRTIHNSY